MLCVWLIASINLFAGSESKETFYILIFTFSTQV